METGSENDPQEEAIVVRNPMNCTAPISEYKLLNWSFLKSLKCTTDVVLQRIQRSASAATMRSPWNVQNLNERLECSVQQFFEKSLDQEASVVQNFRHPHIVGAVELNSLQLYKRHLAMEYCTPTLARILSERYNANQGPLEAPNAMKIALATLRALDYLHSQVFKLHGDLKSFNILVDAQYESIKVCGFGPMTKSFTVSDELESGVCSEMVNSGLWSAPEVLAKSTKITTKADIFSFGMVLFEMLSCMPPHTFPGILDYEIAVPNKMNNAKKPHDAVASDGIKDDEDDEEDELGVTDMHKVKKAPITGTVFARKRKSPMLLPPTSIPGKHIKYDGSVIDLLDEEEPEKAVAEQATLPEAEQQTATDVKEPAQPTPNCNQSDDVKTSAQPPIKPATTAADVILVIDSSDEESSTRDGHGRGTRIKSCDVDSSMDSEVGKFGFISDDEVADTDDMCSDSEEHTVTEEFSDMDEHFLNYGCLGTRPPLPTEIVYGNEYRMLLDMFFLCTLKNADMRPSARQMLLAYEENKEVQP